MASIKAWYILSNVVVGTKGVPIISISCTSTSKSGAIDLCSKNIWLWDNTTISHEEVLVLLFGGLSTAKGFCFHTTNIIFSEEPCPLNNTTISSRLDSTEKYIFVV